MIDVLHVDDENSLLEITDSFLEEEGDILVEGVVSPEEALGLLRNSKFDAVVSDYLMPEMDGIAFLKAVRKFDSKIPFILFTGRGREEIAIEALNNGADFYLNKGSDARTQFAELRNMIIQSVSRRRAEEATEKTMMRFRSLIENVSDVVMVTDVQGMIKYISPSVEKSLGYPHRELLGKDLTGFIHSGDTESARRDRSSFATGETGQHPVEFRIKRADGSYCYLETKTSLVPSEECDRNDLLVIARDTTERKMAESRMEHLNRMLRAIREVNQLIVREKDRDRLLGGACANLVQTEVFRHIWIGLTDGAGRFTRIYGAGMDGHLEQLERSLGAGDVPACVRKATETKWVVSADHDVTCRGCFLAGLFPGMTVLTAQLVTDSRSLGVISASLPPAVFVDEEISLFKEIVTDIAFALAAIDAEEERERVGRALRESEEKYRTLVERANDGITIIQDGVIRYTNPKLAEMGGYSTEEPIGKPFTNFVWPEDVPKLADYYKRRLRGEKVPSIYEARLRGKGGECLYVELNTTVMEYEGRPADFAIVRDLSDKVEAQEAMRQSEQKYRAIFENTGTAMILIEDDMTISLANEEFARLSGFSKQELIEGKIKWTRFASEEDLPKMTEYHRLRRIDPKSAPNKFEFKFVDREGRQHDISATVDMIPGSEQSIASYKDITELKNAQSILKKKKEEEELLLDNIETMVWYATDPETYGVVNRARAEFIGLKKEEMEGKKIWEILPPQEAKVGVVGNRIAFEEKRTYRGDEWVTTAKGEKRLVAVTKIPKLDADGNVQFVVCTGHDITDSKRLEKELHEKSNEQTLLLNNIDTMIYSATDPETHGKMNQARADFLGKRVEELEGMNFRKVMPKESAEVAIAGNRYVFETKEKYHGLEWLKNGKGERRLFSVTKVPMLDEKGNVKFVVASAHDVTDLEEARNALSLANKKLNLLGGVTRHDILNQLTVLRGSLDIVQGIVKDDKARKFLGMALNSSKSIEKYLDFGREYERMGAAKPEWIKAKEACAKGVSSLEMGDVRLDIDLDGLEIYADKLLEKVFHNLVGNALNHGEKVTTVRIYYEGKDSNMILVCEDDGKGIPKEGKKGLFETRRGRGLYLVKEILGITGMKIMETGEEGKGARFEITVPKDKYRFDGTNHG